MHCRSPYCWHESRIISSPTPRLVHHWLLWSVIIFSHCCSHFNIKQVAWWFGGLVIGRWFCNLEDPGSDPGDALESLHNSNFCEQGIYTNCSLSTQPSHPSTVIEKWWAAMRCGNNWHFPWITCPVSRNLQCKLVSYWGLQKWEISHILMCHSTYAYWTTESIRHVWIDHNIQLILKSLPYIQVFLPLLYRMPNDCCRAISAY